MSLTNKRKNITFVDSSSNKRAKVHVQPFIAKLYHMLNSEDEKVRSVVCWIEPAESMDDAVFIIKNSQLFSQNVIPLYFECNLQSFKRQLNYYGFERVNNSDSHQHPNPKKRSRAIRYRHESGKFQYGREDLLHEIHRSTCNDPRIQMDYLREKVTALDKDNNSLKNQVSLLQEKMQEMCDAIKTISSKVTSRTEDNNYLGAPEFDKSIGNVKRLHSVSPHVNDIEGEEDISRKEMALMIPCAPVDRNRQHSLALPPVDDRRVISSSNVELNLQVDDVDDRRDPSVGLLRLGSIMTGGISRVGSIEQQHDWEALREALSSSKILSVSSVAQQNTEKVDQVQ